MVSHSCAGKLGGTTQEQDRTSNPGFQHQEKKTSKPLAIKPVGHSCAATPGGTTGEWDKPHNPELQWGEIKPQNLWLKKPVGIMAVGETPSCTGEFTGENVLSRMYTNPPTQESALEGSTLLVGRGGSDWNLAESGASATVPSQTPSPQTASHCSNVVGYPALVNT